MQGTLTSRTLSLLGPGLAVLTPESKRTRPAMPSGKCRLITFSGVCLLVMLALLSCTADSNESGKSASTDATASTAAAPVAASSSAPTPSAAPTASPPFDGRPVRSAPPDTTDYSKPGR
jgi:hypothetical protein